VARIAAIAVLICSAIVAGGCRSRGRAILEESAVPIAAETVQATMPVSVQPSQIAAPVIETTSEVLTPGGTAATAGGPSSSGAVNAPMPKQSKKAPAGIWPTKVGVFSQAFKGPVWYPKSVPSGYAVDSLDVVEFDPGSGLVCDIVYLKGEKVIQFTQGSPKTRDYEIVSVGKVPWGNKTADVVHQDPADNTTPIVIVYSKGGTFAELTGDASEAELKAVAASMVAVK
jgi:hypothetical protein